METNRNKQTRFGDDDYDDYSDCNDNGLYWALLIGIIIVVSVTSIFHPVENAF